MRNILNICLFLSCVVIGTMARPQSIFDNDQQEDLQPQDPQQDNPFLQQRPQRPQRPVDNPTNPFFPTNAPTAAPAVTTTTARARTTASPQYLACLSRCPSTMEYNPVCGSDSINYHNNGRLECAKFCGKNVSALRGGTCGAL